MNTDACQYGLDGFFAPAVKHFGPYAGRIGVPRDEDYLAGGTTVVCLKLQIDQAVAAIVLRQVGHKVIVRLISFSLLFNHYRLFVLDRIDKVTQLEVSSLKLELIECK